MKYENIKKQIIDVVGGKAPYNIANDHEDMWAITDAHIALFIPHEHIGESGNNKLNYTPVLAQLQKVSPIPYTIEQFQNALSKLESFDGYNEIFKKCDECNGHGEIECSHCGHVDDCGKCNGDGQLILKKVMTGRKQYDYKDRIKVDGVLFDPNVIEKSLQAIRLLGIEKSIFLKTHGGIEKGNMFEISDCKLLMMPMRADSHGTGSIIEVL